MSETREISQEYWRPAQQTTTRPEYTVASVAPYCNLCGTQYAPGARFCHVCGEGREPEIHASAANRIAQVLDFSNISHKLGLSATSLVMAVIAAVCVLAALLTGVVNQARTVVEFEAVQSWRMEWMMAAAVALIAAILFKNSSPAHNE